MGNLTKGLKISAEVVYRHVLANGQPVGGMCHTVVTMPLSEHRSFAQYLQDACSCKLHVLAVFPLD